MPIAPYASLDEIRDAILRRRVVRFQHHRELLTAEPHVLARSRRYGAFIMGAWILGTDSFRFFRYAEIRDLTIMQDSFASTRPEYNPKDRRISQIDTCVRRPWR